jgi:fatty-acyl-CoA synthase
VRPGARGHIFVGSELLFEGYTGGGDKARIGALMSTGDMGHFDADGRLFVDGRDDDMIVSGGENVFPSEVEDLLAGADGVAEVAVVGVADDEFGQRLRAYVVRTPGANPSEDELKDRVRTSLARYKTPREIVFVDELPRNATGKVLKRQLSG